MAQLKEDMELLKKENAKLKEKNNKLRHLIRILIEKMKKEDGDIGMKDGSIARKSELHCKEGDPETDYI